MSKNKSIPYLSWLSSSWIAYYSLPKLFHKCLMHRLKGSTRCDIHIDERNIFPETRYDDTILIGGERESSRKILISECRNKSLCIIASGVYDLRIRVTQFFCHRCEIFLIFYTRYIRSMYFYTSCRYDVRDFITCSDKGIWIYIVHYTARISTIVESCEEYHEDSPCKSDIYSDKSQCTTE